MNTILRLLLVGVPGGPAADLSPTRQVEVPTSGRTTGRRRKPTKRAPRSNSPSFVRNSVLRLFEGGTPICSRTALSTARAVASAWRARFTSRQVFWSLRLFDSRASAPKNSFPLTIGPKPRPRIAACNSERARPVIRGSTYSSISASVIRQNDSCEKSGLCRSSAARGGRRQVPEVGPPASSRSSARLAAPKFSCAATVRILPEADGW